MNDVFAGDLIRPLGLVTLYCGYAEQELDELLRSLSAMERLDHRKRHWTLGQKLARAERLAQQLQRRDVVADLWDALSEGHRLFERRNALVHGCLYAGGHLVPNRDGTPDERVTAEELTELAESIFRWKERIWLIRQKHLAPALLERGTRGTKPKS